MVDDYCRGCIYRSGYFGGAAVTCDYLLRTRERRGCPSGKGCTRKQTSGKVKIRRFAEESTGEKGGWYDD